MGGKRKPIIALMYDFDGTLSPGNMQEFNFIPDLGMGSADFWQECKALAKEQDADEILAYMRHMVRKANEKGVPILRSTFRDYGKTVELFPGVEDWFGRMNQFADAQGVKLEHYIISSGLKEMVEGTPIKKHFERIYASSFMYDQHDVAIWPALAVNYTNKTQFLFRINKDVPEVHDNAKINDFVPEEARHVPFRRMVYFGDGSTDVPCMKLVKDKGGVSIAIYRSKKRGAKDKAKKLQTENRVNFIANGDYRDGTDLDSIVKLTIERMAKEAELKSWE
jgi:phosphoserine phosphatase